MYKRGVTLVSRWDGKKYYFESVLHATCFLNRGACYINNMIKYGGYVRHSETGEQFEVIKDDAPKVGNMEIKNVCQGKMLDKSICNGCARAVCFCSWFAENKPVEGWVAEDSYYEGEWYSYKVIECPLFEPDADTPKERKKQRKRLMEELENGTGTNPVGTAFDSSGLRRMVGDS